MPLDDPVISAVSVFMQNKRGRFRRRTRWIQALEPARIAPAGAHDDNPGPNLGLRRGHANGGRRNITRSFVDDPILLMPHCLR